jgi:hypothetical protein
VFFKQDYVGAVPVKCQPSIAPGLGCKILHGGSFPKEVTAAGGAVIGCLQPGGCCNRMH